MIYYATQTLDEGTAHADVHLAGWVAGSPVSHWPFNRLTYFMPVKMTKNLLHWE